MCKAKKYHYPIDKNQTIKPSAEKLSSLRFAVQPLWDFGRRVFGFCRFGTDTEPVEFGIWWTKRFLKSSKIERSSWSLISVPFQHWSQFWSKAGRTDNWRSRTVQIANIKMALSVIWWSSMWNQTYTSISCCLWNLDINTIHSNAHLRSHMWRGTNVKIY